MWKHSVQDVVEILDKWLNMKHVVERQEILPLINNINDDSSSDYNDFNFSHLE